MSEGESPNKDFKTQIKEALQKAKAVVTGKNPKPTVRVSPEQTPRVRIAPPKVRLVQEDTRSMIDRPLVNAAENPNAATRFIDTLRNPYYYRDYATPTGSVRRSDEFGTEIDSVGFFNTTSVLQAAFQRYQLPLVIYDAGDHHARLVVGSPKPNPARRVTRVPVWDPMRGSITEIIDPDPKSLNSRLLPNGASEEDLKAGIYDLSYINDPTLNRYRDSVLLTGKFARLQYDYKNCVPYCLFVGAMLQALKPGETPFKTWGIPKFSKDFGVQIMTREDITGVRFS